MQNTQLATFGGGCFWCMEAVIQRLKGVEKVVAGYTGGYDSNPTYRSVCSGETGHAEVIQITFNPALISFKELTTVFMTSHDPTSLNQQGANRGTQYRSVIYYHNDEQKEMLAQLIEELKPSFSNPIVTEVSPASTFFPAENYHQDYYNRNSFAGYCRVVIDPKISKLRNQYAHLLKEEM